VTTFRNMAKGQHEEDSTFDLCEAIYEAAKNVETEAISLNTNLFISSQLKR